MTSTRTKQRGFFGSKAVPGLCQTIIAMMPPHETYIETHVGGGAVMKRKPPALNNIAIDLDEQVLNDFTCDYEFESVHACAHQFLSSYPFNGRELIYSDPPYLLQTRTGRCRYRFDYTREQHAELLEILKALPCAVILSGYPSSLYDQALPDWNVTELQAVTWNGQVRTEKLWFNYSPDRVHWHTYAGKNSLDRQRIKRKAENWGRRYLAMPPAERLAVLSAIMLAESRS